MPWVADSAAFAKEMNRISNLLRVDGRFPDPIFRVPMVGFRFIDFDVLWTPQFFEFACTITRAARDEHFSLLVLDPDPTAYYFRHFSRYPFARFSVDDSVQSYVELINADLGDSPADAIAYRTDRIVIHADTYSWCLYGEREMGICVIAASGANVLRQMEAGFPALKIYEAHDVGRELLSTVFAPSSVPDAVKSSLIRNYGDA